MNWMAQLYLSIWADAIHWETNVRKESSREIYLPLAAISVAQFFNVIIVSMILDWTGIVDGLVLRILESGVLYTRFSWILAFLPFIAFNYFIIYRGKRYKRLLADMRVYNGRLYLANFYVSVFCILVPIILDLFASSK